MSNWIVQVTKEGADAKLNNQWKAQPERVISFTCGQSYKRFMLVNYDSRGVPD